MGSRDDSANCGSGSGSGGDPRGAQKLSGFSALLNRKSVARAWSLLLRAQASMTLNSGKPICVSLSIRSRGAGGAEDEDTNDRGAATHGLAPNPSPPAGEGDHGGGGEVLL